MSQKKDKEILFFRESVFKLTKQIFNFPNKTFHIRELTRETGYSTTAITKGLKELNKHDIIILEETPITTNIKANLESEAYRFYKLVFNLYRLQKSGFIDILKEHYRSEAIILFGSFVWGNPNKDSDIDLFIIKQSQKSRIERQRELRLKLFGSDFPAMDILVYTPEEVGKSINEYKNLFIEDILRHGKVLYSKPGSLFNVALPKRRLNILH